MAEAAGKQSVALRLVNIAVSVRRADLDPSRALDPAVKLRYGKAGFKLLLNTARFDNFGVYHFEALVADLHNDNTAQHADLRRGKTDPLRLVERFMHIIKQGKYSRGDLFDLAAHLAERRVAFF